VEVSVLVPFAISLLLVQTVHVPTGSEQRPMSEVEPSPLRDLPAGFEPSGLQLPSRAGEHILVVVASGLETALAPELSQFTTDLTAEGYDVVQLTMTGGTVEDLRNTLQTEPGLEGAILIGNLPRAWYEDTWDATHEEFPIDLFLMDLDGVWIDGDGDGKYDSHTGNRAPEIWTGRIDAHAMEFGSEISMLRNYFMKNHLYRTGALPAPGRAMTYVDDDWSNYYGECGLDAVYTDLTVVNNDPVTTADDYRLRLETGYEFVHLMSHSSPWGHTFKIPGGYGGTVMAPEIAGIAPKTVFVQLFACSNCRWTEPNCLGNWYLFGPGYGLLAFGSTKTGALLEFGELYTPMGAGEIPGEAFRMWFTNVGIYDPDWHYGCVILGDPTLVPLSARELCSSPAGSSGRTSYTDYTCVSTSSHSDCYPTVAKGGGMTWVAWTTGQNGRLDIAARAWDGDSWSSVYMVDPDEYWDVTPFLTMDDSGTPWLAWADFDIDSYGYRIMVATGNELNSISMTANGDGYDVDPSLAFTDRMWLIWQVWRRGEGDIMARALDGSFPETYLTSAGSCDFSPTACASLAGQVHAAWVEGSTEGERIMWTRGDESGFEEPDELSSGSFCRTPCLASIGNTVVIAWQDDTEGSSIRARVLEGNDWGAEATLYSSGTGHAFAPSVGTSPTGATIVAWQTGNGSDAEIWQSTLTASGWDPPAQLVDPEGPAWLPVLCGGTAAWAGTTGGTGNWDIYIALEGGLGTGSSSVTQPFGFHLSENPVGAVAVLLPRMQVQGTIPVELSVFDLSGRIVTASGYADWSGEPLSIQCTSMPSGIYIVRITSEQNSWTGRMTVLR